MLNDLCELLTIFINFLKCQSNKRTFDGWHRNLSYFQIYLNLYFKRCVMGL